MQKSKDQKIIVQLNHPGNEKLYKGEKTEGFCIVNNQIIREWNTDPVHYRKFLRHKGIYISNLDDENPKEAKLLFWGEWEGYSKFFPIQNKKEEPRGIHEPFHATKFIGTQNTDPYVFGDCFKYAICSQTGIMTKLDRGSLILFGTTRKDGFYLDTVFVVKCCIPAKEVKEKFQGLYSKTYIQETLKRLRDVYLGDNISEKNRIYHSRTWFDDKKYFSFVPCQIDKESGNLEYKRAKIDFSIMSTQRVGHPYKHFEGKNPEDIWHKIVQKVLEQGFVLGIKFSEPETNNNLVCETITKTSTTTCVNKKCC